MVWTCCLYTSTTKDGFVSVRMLTRFPTAVHDPIDLNYMQLAAEIIALYVDTVGNEIPFETVRDISGKSFSTFATPEVVTPIVSVNNHKVMELFHGPTLAFKDVALQTLGNVFEFFLEGNRKLNYGQCRMTVMAATSGGKSFKCLPLKKNENGSIIRLLCG